MKKQLSRVGIGMFCYISTVLLFSTPKFTNISIKKNEKIGALGLNFILNMQYLYFRSHRHYSKKGCRWSAYDVKTEKSYPHVPSIMRGIIEARLGDAVGMNQKVILERDDPRQLSATIAPIPPPPTAEIIAEYLQKIWTQP
jgi:hypothetical protein